MSQRPKGLLESLERTVESVQSLLLLVPPPGGGGGTSGTVFRIFPMSFFPSDLNDDGDGTAVGGESMLI